jgi:hypothetical protein
MKSNTIYEALRIMYHRGDLEGDDLAEFIGIKKLKSCGIKIELTLECKLQTEEEKEIKD